MMGRPGCEEPPGWPPVCEDPPGWSPVCEEPPMMGRPVSMR